MITQHYTEDFLIASTKAPEPLTNEEVYSYFKKMKQGDLDARNQIINHNLRLVFYIVKTIGTDIYEFEELSSVGYIGLIKSVDSFDITKNIKFATYASRCIYNEIYMYMRKAKKHIYDESIFSTKTTNKEGNELSLDGMLADPFDFTSDIEKQDLYADIRKIIAELPDKSRIIMLLSFGFIEDRVYTQKEIAKKLGISQSRISRIIKKTLKIIREKLKQLESTKPMELPSTKSNLNDKGQIAKEKIETRNCLIQEEQKESKPNLQPNKKKGRKLQTIYEYFNEYTKEQIDEMLLKLTEDDRKLLICRYGEDLEHPVSSIQFTIKEKNKFYSQLVPKMRKLLLNPNDIKPNKKKGRKLQTIYEYFNEYTKEQIDEMLLKLTEDDRKLLICRYGEDLERPVSSIQFTTDKEKNKFYSQLVPKMRELLRDAIKNPKINSTKEEYSLAKKEVLKKEILHFLSIDVEKFIKSESHINFDELDTLDILKVFNLNCLTSKDLTRISFILKYIEYGDISVEVFAEIFNISKIEVVEIFKTVLLVCKENINQLIDQTVEGFVDSSDAYTKK